MSSLLRHFHRSDTQHMNESRGYKVVADELIGHINEAQWFQETSSFGEVFGAIILSILFCS